MYIIYETIASNDPRYTPLIEYIATEWHYTIGYIAPENLSNVNLPFYKATEINESVAHAHQFTNAVNGEISLMRSTNNPKEMVQPTSEGDADYVKVAYKMTAEDEMNAVSLLKSMMLNWAENHYTEETGLIQIRTEVPGLRRLKETQMYMATYFEIEFASTQGKEKNPLFTTPKFTVENIT